MFRRIDIGGDVKARHDHVSETRLCTVVSDPFRPDVRVGTIEHLLAALACCGIDNVLVTVDGPEIPALDGSAAPFVFLIDCAGRLAQSEPRRTIEIMRAVRVEDGEAFVELRPAHAEMRHGSFGLAMSLRIEFTAAAIGSQALSFRMSEAEFRAELQHARTFTQSGEIAALRSAGLAQGGSLDNAVVVEGDRVLNPGGLRMQAEFVRHKMLDAVGDLSLAGARLQGSFIGYRSGHHLNNRALRALLVDPMAWRWADVAPVRDLAWSSHALVPVAA